MFLPICFSVEKDKNREFKTINPDVREIMIEVDPHLALPDDARGMDVNKTFGGKEKKTGAPWRIWTFGLLFRRQSLYPLS